MLENLSTRFGRGVRAGLIGATMIGAGVLAQDARAEDLPVDAVIPAAAANSGAYGTYWGTDVWLVNLSESEGTVEIRAGNEGQPASESLVSSWALPPGQAVTLQDVLSSFPGFSAPGALFLTYEGVDPVDVVGASRTYTRAPSGAPGTLGQGMPLLQIRQLYGSGTPMYAPIAGREGFRTNLGLVNAGPTEATLLVEVVGEGGELIGDTTLTLPPESWRQQEVFSTVGVQPTALAYVTIVGQSGSLLWAYTSEVDNATGDPTTMGAKTAYAGTQQLFVPAVAHLDGANGTTWVTDLDYVNLSSSPSSANLVFLEEGVDNYANPGPAQAFDLTSGQHRFFADVLVELFGITGKKGSLWSEPPDTHLIWSRTSNQGPSGTFGQELPAIIGDTDMIAGDLEGVLVGLSENDEYRTNLGLLNTGTTTATFEVKVYDDAGTTLRTISRDVPPMSLAQLNRVYGSHTVSNGRIDVKVTSGQGFAYSSMVDESTGDPTTQYATITTPPPTEQIVSISVCSPTGTGGQGSCPSGTFETHQVVLGPDGAPLNDHGVGGVTDEHASILPPRSLQGISDYLFFVAAGTDVHPHNIGVVALSGGSGPDANGQWTLDFAPGYGSYTEGYGQVFQAPIDQIRCPTVADGDPTHQDQTFDLNYAAAGTVVPDPTSSPGTLLMIYEGCNACIGSAGGHRTGEGAYISVGVATSLDYGRTWPTYRGTATFEFVPLPDSSWDQGPSAPFGALGQSVCMGNDCTSSSPPSYGRYAVLTPPVSLAWLVESGHSASDAAHDSEISAFVDTSGPDRYVYEVHIYEPGDAAGSQDQFPDGRDHDLTVARARLNGGTAPLNFLKWDGQSFSQPGIGGHEVQILPDGAFESCGDLDQNRGQGSISYVPNTQQYLLTFVCGSRGDPAGGAPGSDVGSAWFYATTDDLSHQQWSTPREIIGSWMVHDTGPGGSYGCQSYMGWYPTFMSLNHNPGHLALHGYAFSMWGCLGGGANPPMRQYVSHAFTITTGPIQPKAQGSPKTAVPRFPAVVP